MFMLNTEQEELEEHKQSLTMTKAQLATERGEGIRLYLHGVDTGAGSGVSQRNLLSCQHCAMDTRRKSLQGLGGGSFDFMFVPHLSQGLRASLSQALNLLILNHRDLR